MSVVPILPTLEHSCASALIPRRILVRAMILPVRMATHAPLSPSLSYTPIHYRLTTFAYIPTSLLYIIPVMKYRPDMITPEARAIPQKVWGIMGLLDSLAGVMQSLAVAKLTSGSLIVLLLQSAIPTSMIITKLFLKTKCVPLLSWRRQPCHAPLHGHSCLWMHAHARCMDARARTQRAFRTHTSLVACVGTQT